MKTDWTPRIGGVPRVCGWERGLTRSRTPQLDAALAWLSDEWELRQRLVWGDEPAARLERQRRFLLRVRAARERERLHA